MSVHRRASKLTQNEMVAAKIKTGKCPLGNHPEPEHTCPYEEIINGDKTFKCVCCDECKESCAKQALY